VGAGQTVAGFCNATVGSGSTDLKGPWGLYVTPSDGTLYVTDYTAYTYQMFSPFSRTGYIFFSNDVTYPSDVFVDSSGKIYMVYESGVDFVVSIEKAGVIVRTLPPGGVSSSSCNFTEIYNAYGVAVDQSGNIYVSQYSCYMVVKWALNATKGTLVAGQPGISGSTSTTLSSVRYIHLDEDRGALYVSDTGNNRIQKFIIGGNGTGVTVAGGNGAGTNLNQLNSPAGIRVTSDGQTLYISDHGNNRIMKWVIGASQGVVVAGSASGVAGSTSQLLNRPGGLGLDPTEMYLYVADNGNYRVQRFRVQ
jgi:DNA-binding beta-propeller fold protein YncE